MNVHYPKAEEAREGFSACLHLRVMGEVWFGPQSNN